MFSRFASNLILAATRRSSGDIAALSLKRNRLGSVSSYSQTTVVSRQSPTRKKILEQHAARKVPKKMTENQQPNKTKLLAVGGNTVLFFGMSMWLLLFVDRYFQNRERECIAKAQEELYREFGDFDELAAKYKDHPAQFSCVVRLKSRELYDLFPVRVGDVVDVLVEGVGHDRNLNICRSRPRNPEEAPIVSFYPIGCLQRLKTEQTDSETTMNA